MTLSEHAGRLFVSVATIIAHAPRSPSEPDARCGIDLGIGQEWAVVAHADGSIQRVTHPASWAATHIQRRRAARQASRRIVGSRGHRQARTKLAALDRRAASLRRESMHTMTTALARRYGTIVVEDLDVAAMAWAWAGAHSAGRCIRPESAGSGPSSPTRPGGREASSSWPTAGLRPPRPITAAVATSRTSS
jgi:Probable transposase